MSGIQNLFLGGAVGRVTVPLVISANTTNYDVYTNRGPLYVPGKSDITVTINPGVTVGSTSTPTYALSVPSAFSPLDTVTIINNGLIQGMGGAGGAGGNALSGPIPLPTGFANSSPGGAGSAGGSALYVNRPTTVTNPGTIAGGGGGGGGGGGYVTLYPTPKGYNYNRAQGAGGGGGSGTNGGAGGLAGSSGPGPAPVPAPTPVGSAGTSPAGGAGGVAIPVAAGPTNTYPGNSGAGGTGGGRGAAGAAGNASVMTPTNPVEAPPRPGGAGGAAGNYIVGNPFVTWPVTGTRQGGVA